MQRSSAAALAFRLTEHRPRELGRVRGALAAWNTAPSVLLFALAALFFLVSHCHVDPLAHLELPRDATVVEGRVVSTSPVRNKNGHIRGYHVDVGFTSDGAPHVVSRYATTAALRALQGQPLTVTLDPRAPSRARVGGMKVTETAAVVVTLGLAGFAALAFVGALVITRRRLALLANGLVTTARVFEHQTSRGSKGRTIHTITFGYEAQGGRFKREVRTQTPELLLDEKRETLVYDELKPDRAFLLDELSLSPRVGDDGTVTLKRAGQLRLALVAWIVLAPLSLLAVVYPFIANRS